MTRTFVLAFALLLTTIAAQDPPPPQSAAQAPESAASKAAAKVAAAREKRLASQRAALEAEIAAMEKFGRVDEFLARIDAISVGRGDLPESEDGYPIPGGMLPWRTLDNFALWHRPRDGRQLPTCVDVEQPNHPFTAIVDTARQLRAADIDLLVVAFPTRVELYPELILELKDMSGFAGMGIGSVRFLLELNRVGVETLSLGPSMVAQRHNPDDPDDPLYLAGDPHWRPRGAEIAAMAVAKQVRQYSWFVPGSLLEGRDFKVREEYYVFDVATDEMADRNAKPERVSANCVTVRGFNQGEFEPKFARIIVIGDSFVRVHGVHGADFASHLLRFTGQQLDVVNAAFGAQMISRQKLAMRPPEEWRGKKVVVWLLQNANFRPTERWAPLPLGLK